MGAILVSPVSVAASKQDDAALLQRLKARDKSAVEDLLRLHGSKIYGIALQITRNEQTAQEVMQDALIAIWNKIDTFEERAAFTSWLYRVTANAALMALRRKNKLAEREIPLDASEDDSDVPAIQIPASGNTPAETALQTELGNRVRAAIEALPEPYRTTVILSDVNGLSLAEIAEATDASVSAAKSRLHRGRLALRRALLPYLKEEVS
jgi:RNA polymerase sigma-70 factor (ECF subfamily)